MPTLYDTKPWRDLRESVLADDASCAFEGLAGECLGALHVHHIEPVAEGGEAIPSEDGVRLLCARHHRMLHVFLDMPLVEWKRCPHYHRTPAARERCEKRINRV